MVSSLSFKFDEIGICAMRGCPDNSESCCCITGLLTMQASEREATRAAILRWVEPSQKALRQGGPEAAISCRNVIQRAGASSGLLLGDPSRQPGGYAAGLISVIYVVQKHARKPFSVRNNEPRAGGE